MFIQGVNPKLHISDPLQMVQGMDIWHVGQGGITNVSEPYFVGRLAGVDMHVSPSNVPQEYPGFFMYQPPNWSHLSSSSMLDGHILPQTYNNWYYCSSEENARAIYDYMKGVWESDPAYEEQRQIDLHDSRWDFFDEYYDNYDD